MAKDKSKGKKEAEEAEAPDADKVEGEDGAEGEEGGKKKAAAQDADHRRRRRVRGAGRRRRRGLSGPRSPATEAHKLPPKAKGDKKDGKADPNAPQVQDGPDGWSFYTPPDIVVNMQTPDGKPTFLKLKLTFELPDHDTADTIDAEMPRLQDVFQTFLRELRPNDLAGSDGHLSAAHRAAAPRRTS